MKGQESDADGARNQSVPVGTATMRITAQGVGVAVAEASILLKAPLLSIGAIVTPGEKTPEGRLIESVAPPWFNIIELIQTDPEAIYQFGWRRWEEIVAGAYREEGYDVYSTTGCSS